jgi:phage shock protein C
MGLRRKFEVDRTEAKLMGVCAGLANHSNVDVTVIRIAFVLATVLGGFPWTLIGYFLLGLFGQPKRARTYRDEHAPVRGARIEATERIRDLDRRLADIETYVTSSNSKLAREIEDLR